MRMEDLSARLDELEFLPETFREWMMRSERGGLQGLNWRHYTILMLTFAEAFSRAPMTAQECNDTNIILHLDEEIEKLTNVIHQITNGTIGGR